MTIELFKENKIIGGYSLAVRDDWSFKIKRVNITKKEMESYKRMFGKEIVTYEKFFSWWVSNREENMN